MFEHNQGPQQPSDDQTCCIMADKFVVTSMNLPLNQAHEAMPDLMSPYDTSC